MQNKTKQELSLHGFEVYDLGAGIENLINLKKNKSRVIYTCVTDGYSAVQPAPIELQANFDFYLFSTEEISVTGWTSIRVNKIFDDPRKTAKLFKVLPHLFFSDYSISVWVDGNVLVYSNLSLLIDDFTHQKTSCLFFQHNLRKCIYAEANECIKWALDDPKRIKSQVNFYQNAGHPKDWGLYACRVLVRKHNSAECKYLMESWWREICTGSIRDQISLPYVLRDSGINWSILPYESFHLYFTVMPHKKYRTSSRLKHRLSKPYAFLAPLLFFHQQAKIKFKNLLKKSKNDAFSKI